MSKGLSHRPTCSRHETPLLLDGTCPYCSEDLDLLGEFIDWVDSGGAERD